MAGANGKCGPRTFQRGVGRTDEKVVCDFRLGKDPRAEGFPLYKSKVFSFLMLSPSCKSKDSGSV